jgi:hypothetical protein
MQPGILFWVLMILWAVFWGWGYWTPEQPFARGGGYLLTFALFFIIGWKLFGPPVQ